MAQLYTSGPCHIFLNGLLVNTPQYLGTSEFSPHVELVPMYEDVFNAIGGRVPFDKAYQGEVGIINFRLNRFNYLMYQALAARPRSPLAVGTGPALGVNAAGDVGSLVLTEGLALGLVLQFQFGAQGQSPKPAMVTGAMPAGYYFPAAVPIGPDKHDPLGTLPEVIDITFFALRAFNPITQTFGLYSQTLPPNLIVN